MKYDTNTGARKGFNWWIVVSVLFMGVSGFLALILWQNSKPLDCKVSYMEANKLICERYLDEVSN